MTEPMPSSNGASEGGKLRLLCLATREPWPPTDGGKESVHGAVQALARTTIVRLACPGKPASAEARAHYESIEVDYRPVDFVPRESPDLVISALLQLKPFKFHKYGDSVAERLFDVAIGPFEPDAIICFHAHMEQLGQRLRRRRGWKAPVLIREENIEYGLLRSYLATRPFWQRVLGAPIQWLTRREVWAIWRRADVTAFLSDGDFKVAKATGVSGNLVLIPGGIPLPALRQARRPAGPPQLLIPLNWRAPQSMANFRKFLYSYWAPMADTPELQGVSLTVTGVDEHKLAELSQMSVAEQRRLRVHAKGFLPSLQPAFASALALVAPTFIGSGIRMKVLEGMANQVPIIATDLDIQTCAYFKRGHNILPLGEPREFAAAVRSLRDNEDLWNQLSGEGRRTVEVHADWGRFAELLLAELRQVRAGPCVGAAAARPGLT